MKMQAAGQPNEAAALLRTEVGKNPDSKPLMLLYARALADAGQNEEALAAFGKAFDPKKPNWRIPNAEGVLLDRLGRMPEAQQRYQAALQIEPEDPVILTNLGLSFALSDRPAEAEAALRRAAERPGATAKVRQNLALVLAIQGKYAEAEAIARKDLPPEQAAANVKYWQESFKPKAVAAPPKAAAKPAPTKPPKTARPAAPAKPAPAAAKIEEPPKAAPAAKVIEDTAPAKPAEAPLQPETLDLRT